MGEFSCFCAVRGAGSTQGIGPGEIICCTDPDARLGTEGVAGIVSTAELWAPSEIPNKFKRLPFAGILGEVPPHDLDQLVFTGNCFVDEVFFFHLNSHSVIMADFIQNHRREKGKPVRNTLFKLAGVAYPQGGIALDIRLSFTNRNLARRSLEKLLSWDFGKLILAHGVCIEKDAKPFVERAFRWLAR